LQVPLNVVGSPPTPVLYIVTSQPMMLSGLPELIETRIGV
jgi:hypothetical protein